MVKFYSLQAAYHVYDIHIRLDSVICLNTVINKTTQRKDFIVHMNNEMSYEITEGCFNDLLQILYNSEQ